MAIDKIGIIGTGQGAATLARRFASRGKQVLLVSPHRDQLETTIQMIRSGLENAEATQSELITAWDQTLENINLSLDLKSLGSVDLIYNLAITNPGRKAELFQELDGLALDTCLLATVLSGDDELGRLPTVTTRPRLCVFVQPYPSNELIHWLEIYPALETSISTQHQVSQLFKETGFVTALDRGDHRASLYYAGLLPTIHRSLWLLFENEWDGEFIDRWLQVGWQEQKGILRTADQIGLDIILRDLEKTLPTAEICPLLKRMVQAGQLGVASGQGFFSYLSKEINQESAA